MFATVEKTQAGFDAAEKRIKDLEGDLNQAKKNLQNLGESMKALYREGPSSASSSKLFWPNEGHARTFGMLVLSAAGKMVNDPTGVISKALSEGSNVGGGYSVPTEMMARIIDMLGSYGKFRANCPPVPMGSDKLIVPKITSDATVFCPGEGKEVTESELNFGQVLLSSKTFASLVVVSKELRDDSILAIGEIVARSITRSLARKEDEIGFTGDGTSAYFGMTGITGVFKKMIEDGKTPAGLYTTEGPGLNLDDFQECVALLPEEYDETAAWYMSKKFFFRYLWPLIREGGFANIFNVMELFGVSASKSPMGYPVRFIKSLPTSTSLGQIECILGDLQSGAYLGERKQLILDSSEHVLFKNYQTAIMGVERVDINIFGCGDETNPGPIVALRTAPQQ
ncbi:MAG TPA: phage major capsid protein [Candidatus Bathyarchaeia archaeon]|nr:phage major capsid protein [Candidatus Bathyarchaeia archaeon]